MQKNPKTKSERNLKQSLSDYAKYSSLGFQMLFVILLGVWGGFQLDKYIGIKFPVFTLVFTILSVALAVYLGVKDFLKK